MAKKRSKGTFDFEGYEIRYAWAKNKLTVCSRTGPSLIFQVFSSRNLEKEQPREVAKEIYQSAVIAGVVTSDGQFRDSLLENDHAFYAEGPVILSSGNQKVGVFLRSVVLSFKPKGMG